MNDCKKRKLKKTGLALCCLWITISVTAQIMEDKIDGLIGRLTLEEKITLLHADTKFTSGGVPRLGIPAIRMSDGPGGVRAESKPDSFDNAGWKNDDGIYLPALTAIASTWNPVLAQQCGAILGQESRIRGKHIQLAPGINILRTPLNGRNWEYLGEDPFLVARMAVPLVRGIQSAGVAACIKHFALNNQETGREYINVEVDERAFREIYLPGFEAAVKEAGVLAVMGAYNKFRGQYASQNQYLLSGILKTEWGFKGVVISDWNAAHNTLEAARNGLDIEMGTERPYNEYFMARPLLDAVRKGLVGEDQINDKLRRILRLLLTIDAIGQPPFDTTGMYAGLATPERCLVTRQTAEEAIVLLKNSCHILPLDPAKIKSIAVIRGNAKAEHAAGGGSTTIDARYEISPLEGLQNRLGDKIRIRYVPGYESNRNNETANEAQVLDSVSREWISRAVEAAKASDYAIIFGGLNHNYRLEGEGHDRKNMKLPYGQDILIREVVKANPNTIVVMLCGTPVELGDWYENTPGVLQHSYLGMEGGNALARVIFGDINPSGKLPYTFPRKLRDSPAHILGEYPGKDSTVQYNEGIYVGYRYFDAKGVEPMFPFGYGLSYTSFEYSGLRVDHNKFKADQQVVVSVDIKNTGSREGRETVQLYVSDLHSSLPRPVKELKAFGKLNLAPGETGTLCMTLDRSSFAYYDPARQGWVAEPGDFRILVGSSSKDIRLREKITLR